MKSYYWNVLGPPSTACLSKRDNALAIQAQTTQSAFSILEKFTTTESEQEAFSVALQQ